MRKMLKLACIILAVGIVLAGTGIIIAVKKDGVTYYDIMDVVKVNLTAPEEQLKAEMPELPDLTKIKEAITASDYSYGLNEFNTVCVYSDSIQTELYHQSEDKLTVTVHSGSVISAAAEGTLYVKAKSDGNTGMLRIGIPDSYKGGLIICGVSSRISCEPFESAMDISVNLKSSSFTAPSFTADSVSLSCASSRADLGSITSDSLSAVCVSSELSTESVGCKETSLKADNSTITLHGLGGGFTSDVTRTTYNVDFSGIMGNITVTAESSRGNIYLPNTEMTLVRDESYALLKNYNASVSEENQAKYTIETDIKYSILNIY